MAEKAAAGLDSAGFVMELAGDWRITGEKAKLSGGQKLPAGATIEPEKPGPKTYIVVCLHTGEAKTYTSKTKLPERVESSVFSRIWTAIQGHYRSGVVHAVSRGVLQDGVAQLDGGQLQLAPLLKALPKETYLFKFTPPASDAKQTADAAVTLELTWDPAKPQSMAAEKLPAGLYQVQLINKRTKKPTLAEAWVLVVANDFPAKQKAFEEVVTAVNAWDEPTRAKAGRSFLKACLEALAEPADVDSPGPKEEKRRG